MQTGYQVPCIPTFLLTWNSPGTIPYTGTDNQTQTFFFVGQTRPFHIQAIPPSNFWYQSNCFFVSCQNGIYYMHTKSYAFLDYKECICMLLSKCNFLGGSLCNALWQWLWLLVCTINQKHFLAAGEIAHDMPKSCDCSADLIHMWIARIYCVWQCRPKGAHFSNASIKVKITE